MVSSHREVWFGRVLLTLLMLGTIMPFVTLFVTALHPSGSYPSGLSWPETPHWENFISAFKVANMHKMLASSIMIELGVVPVALLIATLAGFALGHLRPPGGRFVFLAFVLGITLPYEGIIIPL
jgi:raffinose/stachyose/melibiose transport system permease protein